MNELLTNIEFKKFIKTKMEMVLAATHVENSEGPQAKIALCIKDKGKNVF